MMVCGTAGAEETGADETGDTSDEEGAEYEAGVTTLVEMGTDE